MAGGHRSRCGGNKETLEIALSLALAAGAAVREASKGLSALDWSQLPGDLAISRQGRLQLLGLHLLSHPMLMLALWTYPLPRSTFAQVLSTQAALETLWPPQHMHTHSLCPQYKC